MKSKHLDWASISDRVKESDQAAFKELFDRLNVPLYTFVMAKLQNAPAAEDILQDTFIRIWEQRSRLDSGRSIVSYIYTVAQNLCLNHLRHVTVLRKHTADEDEVTHHETPQAVLEKQEFSGALKHAVDALPEQSRVVFLMSRVDELSYQAIAERLDISIRTVENHIGKALKLIRIALAEYR